MGELCYIRVYLERPNIQDCSTVYETAEMGNSYEGNEQVFVVNVTSVV